MEAYKQEFIDFMVESDVLKFGEFTLKSGRKSPFFMNAGAYVTGSQLKKLGEYYAKQFMRHMEMTLIVLFGPAYKGSTAWSCNQQSLTVNYMEKRFVIVLIVRKRKITVQIREAFLEAS